MDEWCRRRALSRGAVISLDQCWKLAQRWYEGRLAPEWRGRSPEKAQAALESVGLTGPFWRMS